MKKLLSLFLCLGLLMAVAGCHPASPTAELPSAPDEAESLLALPDESVGETEGMESVLSEMPSDPEADQPSSASQSPASSSQTRTEPEPESTQPTPESTPTSPSEPSPPAPPVEEIFVPGEVELWSAEYYHSMEDSIRLLRSSEDLSAWFSSLCTDQVCDHHPYYFLIEDGQTTSKITTPQKIGQSYADVWKDHILVGAYVSYPGRVKLDPGKITVQDQCLTLALQATETESEKNPFHAISLYQIKKDAVAGVTEAKIVSQFQAQRQYFSEPLAKSPYTTQRWNVPGVSQYVAGSKPALLRTTNEFTAWLNSTYPESRDGCVIYEPRFSRVEYPYSATLQAVADPPKTYEAHYVSYLSHSHFEQGGGVVVIPIDNHARNATVPIIRLIERKENRLVVHYDSYRYSEEANKYTWEVFFLLCNVDPTMSDGVTGVDLVRTDYYRPLNY